MSTTVNSNLLAQALFDCIVESSEGAQKDLFAVLNTYKEAYGRTYVNLMQHPFSAKLISAIEEAQQFMQDMEECNKQNDEMKAAERAELNVQASYGG